MSDRYDLQLAASAARAIQKTLPEGVAAAVTEFLTGSLITNPRRVGKPLRRELTGLTPPVAAPFGSSIASTTPRT